jgi:uncharacterized protein YycO
MSRRRLALGFVNVILVAALVLTSLVTSLVMRSVTPVKAYNALQLTEQWGRSVAYVGETVSIGTFTISWNGSGSVWLTGSAAGIQIAADDALVVTSGSGSLAFENAGYGVYQGIPDITSILTQGANNITLEVRDIYGDQIGTTAIWVYYTAPQDNQPPTALFKSYNIVDNEAAEEDHHMAGGRLLFDASASYDPDASAGALNNGIKEYHWDFADGTDPVVTTNPKYEHVFVDPEIYVVKLTVVDEGDNPSEICSESLDLSLLPGDLIFLRSGPPFSTIFNMIGNKYTHVGMYVGTIDGIHYMIEADYTRPPLSKKTGVQLTRFGRWSSQYETYADVCHVFGATPDIRSRAVAWAMTKLGSKYDLSSVFAMEKQLDEYECAQKGKAGSLCRDVSSKYYCSELLWAAYHRVTNGDIDLSEGKEGAVSPDRIFNSDYCSSYASHHEHDPE